MSCADYAKLGKYLNIMMPVTKDDFSGAKYVLSTKEGYSTETLNSKGFNKTYQNEFKNDYIYGVDKAKTSMIQSDDPCYFSHGPYSNFVQSGKNNNATCDQFSSDGKFVCGYCEIPGSMESSKKSISIPSLCDGYTVTKSSNGVLTGTCNGGIVTKENFVNCDTDNYFKNDIEGCKPCPDLTWSQQMVLKNKTIPITGKQTTYGKRGVSSFSGCLPECIDGKYWSGNSCVSYSCQNNEVFDIRKQKCSSCPPSNNVNGVCNIKFLQS